MTIYELAFHYAVGVDDYFNVVHYDITGDSPLDLQDLTDEIASQWAATQGTVTAPACEFKDITYRLDIDGSVGSTITPSGGAEAGTDQNDRHAGQLAVLVQKKTNGLVRPVMGRAFVPGITANGLNVLGGWTAGVLTNVEAFWDGIILVPFAGNGQAEMLLKASNPSQPNTNAYNSVAECVALPTPSVLQSRKRGRGA